MGSQVEISKISINFCPQRLFLAISTDPDEIPEDDAFHLGHHSLPKYLFEGIQNEKGYWCRLIFCFSNTTYVVSTQKQ